MELALYDWGASPAMDLKAVRRLWPADPAHKVLIVLDGVDGAAIAWDDLPGDILQLVLHAVMMEDKKAPRVAAVKASWAAALQRCLHGFCGGEHLWWSPPFPPLLPHLDHYQGQHSTIGELRSEHPAHRKRSSRLRAEPIGLPAGGGSCASGTATASASASSLLSPWSSARAATGSLRPT